MEKEKLIKLLNELFDYYDISELKSFKFLGKDENGFNKYEIKYTMKYQCNSILYTEILLDYTKR